jgi:hypothetical protein
VTTMGFQKGAISLSPLKDIPLLLQVLHSQFITHDQLFEFMQRRCIEATRAPFNWRVRRLVKAGLLERHSVLAVTPNPIYSIANVGAVMLAEHCPVLDGRRHKDAATHVNLVHSLELNGLQLSLARQGVLEDWQSEMTIRAKNELTASGYAKDYDAIVTVRIDDRSIAFALEYERTAKKSKDYARIRGLLEQEDQVRRFLYIVLEPKLASFLLDCFNKTKAALFVGLASDFTRSFQEMSVIEARSGLITPIIAAL